MLAQDVFEFNDTCFRQFILTLMQLVEPQYAQYLEQIIDTWNLEYIGDQEFIATFYPKELQQCNNVQVFDGEDSTTIAILLKHILKILLEQQNIQVKNIHIWNDIYLDPDRNSARGYLMYYKCFIYLGNGLEKKFLDLYENISMISNLLDNRESLPTQLNIISAYIIDKNEIKGWIDKAIHEDAYLKGCSKPKYGHPSLVSFELEPQQKGYKWVEWILNVEDTNMAIVQNSFQLQDYYTALNSSISLDYKVILDSMKRKHGIALSTETICCSDAYVLKVTESTITKLYKKYYWGDSDFRAYRLKK